MLLTTTSGATGGGFISGAAGPVLLIVLAVALVAVPAVREALSTWAGSFREHLFGPAEDTAAAVPNQIGTGETDTQTETVLASERDSYDFDLDVLSEGDTC